MKIVFYIVCSGATVRVGDKTLIYQLNNSPEHECGKISPPQKPKRNINRPDSNELLEESDQPRQPELNEVNRDHEETVSNLIDHNRSTFK